MGMRQPFFDLRRLILGGCPRVIGWFGMGVVAQVLRLNTRLMHAVGRHRTPAELEYDQCRKHQYESTSHRLSIAPQVASQQYRMR